MKRAGSARVAQWNRALACGARGRAFESRRGRLVMAVEDIKNPHIWWCGGSVFNVLLKSSAKVVQFFEKIVEALSWLYWIVWSKWKYIRCTWLSESTIRLELLNIIAILLLVSSENTLLVVFVVSSVNSVL